MAIKTDVNSKDFWNAYLRAAQSMQARLSLQKKRQKIPSSSTSKRRRS